MPLGDVTLLCHYATTPHTRRYAMRLLLLSYIFRRFYFAAFVAVCRCQRCHYAYAVTPPPRYDARQHAYAFAAAYAV